MKHVTITLLSAGFMFFASCKKDPVEVSYSINTDIGSEWIYKKGDTYTLHRNERVTGSGTIERAIYDYDYTTEGVRNKIRVEYICNKEDKWWIGYDSTGVSYPLHECAIPSVVKKDFGCSDALSFDASVFDLYEKEKINGTQYNCFILEFHYENGESKKYYSNKYEMVKVKVKNKVTIELVKTNF